MTLEKYKDVPTRTILEEAFKERRVGIGKESMVEHDIDHAVKYNIDTALAALLSVGYKIFNIKDDDMGGIWRTFELQRRVDTSYLSLPLCLCNDKVFVNATVHVADLNDGSGTVMKSVDMNIVHEAAEDQWIKLKPYGRVIESFNTGESVLEHERKLVTLWSYAHAIYNDEL